MSFIGQNSFPFAENQLPRGVRTLGGLSDANTSNDSIGIGTNALQNSTALGVVAIGDNVANNVDTGAKSVSIGSAFGTPFDNVTSFDGIGSGSVAIGTSCNGNAGANLGTFSVMIGGATCYNGCGADVVAIGKAAGSANPPGANSIQIGTDAGQGTSSAVGASSICIGNQAGATGAGVDSILIGQGSQGTTNNSIVINATGTTTASVASGLVIKPIATESTVSLETSINLPETSTGFTQVLVFNPTTGEIRAVTQPTIP
jgi:hypothetical protein